MSNHGSVKDHIQKIPELMADGYSCAEAVGETLVLNGLNRNDIPIRAIIRPFRGGVASSHEEICGALSGALAALGLAVETSSDNIEDAKALSAAMRDAFLDRYKTTTCRHLIGAREGDDQSAFCRSLSTETAQMAWDLIHRYSMDK